MSIPAVVGWFVITVALAALAIVAIGLAVDYLIVKWSEWKAKR